MIIFLVVAIHLLAARVSVKFKSLVLFILPYGTLYPEDFRLPAGTAKTYRLKPEILYRLAIYRISA